ncbi:MAG: hypothetical protein OXG71_11580 [Rhodospirillales bacterium]|nr:hypothetical protein [Rhodospirillales bacterium]
MVRYGIFRRPGRDGDDIRFNRVHPAMAFLLRPAYPEALLALPVQPPSRLGARVPAVGLAATRAAAFRTAGLRAILMTVIAARAENDLDAAPLAEENPAL